MDHSHGLIRCIISLVLIVTFIGLSSPCETQAVPINDWVALGNGLGGTVLAVVVYGPDVYVGGNFQDAGGIAGADNIARWDMITFTWHALGTGVTFNGSDGEVDAIAIIGSNLYVGGYFNTVDGDSGIFNIARWSTTGSDWYGLTGNGAGPSTVRALAASGTDLYVGGEFDNAGGAANTNHIARYDTLTATWHEVSGGMTDVMFDRVLTLAAEGGNLYVGGTFLAAGGVTNADNIARWDMLTSTWNAMGSGLSSTVWDIAVEGKNVYAGGEFTAAGGNPDGDFIARWDTSASTWNPLGYGLNATVLDLDIAGPVLYAGGSFTDAGGGDQADHVARFVGNSWSSLSGTISDTVWVITSEGAQVFIGGDFLDAGGEANADRIVRYDTSEATPAWNALGGGLNGRVNVITVVGPDIYAGGIFSNAGGDTNADNIARWDGHHWNALGTGLNGEVTTIVSVGPDLYVGGNFTNAGNAAGDYIARWDGTAWHDVGGGVSNPDTGGSMVTAIAVSGSSLYVGGRFHTVGSGPMVANHIARFDGTSWHYVGGGPQNVAGEVYAIAVSGRDVYIGGLCNVPGVPNTANIFRWNGSNWSALGTGIPDGYVLTLEVGGSMLYAGGNFSNAGGVSNTPNIARWDGSAWNALGGGLNDSVYSIEVVGELVYVGGAFTNAGYGADRDYFALWYNYGWNALISGDPLTGTVRDVTAVGADRYAGGEFLDAGGNASGDRIIRWGTYFHSSYLPMLKKP